MINREEGEKFYITGRGKGGLMDWDLKASARDLSELGREYGRPFTALAGSRSRAVLRSGGGFTLDLGLGRLGDFKDGSLDKLTVPRVQQIVPSPLNSSKKTNRLNGIPNVVCLVEGCKSDLSKCRQYYRRHRVCEHHSKAPIVIVGGKVQRFCQQCSRFHSLIEFDEVKRSCRKRLDRHNRRRRKPQPDPLNMGNGCCLSNHKGAIMSQFSVQQACATTAANSLPWLCAPESQQKLQINDQRITFLNSSAFICDRGDRQFPILQANNLEKGNRAASGISIWLQDVCTTASSEDNSGHHKMLSSLLRESDDSKCALYLLSTHQPKSLLSLLSTQNCRVASYSCSECMKDKAVDPAGVPDINNSNNGCTKIFHLIRPDGLLNNHELFNFSKIDN